MHSARDLNTPTLVDVRSELPRSQTQRPDPSSMNFQDSFMTSSKKVVGTSNVAQLFKSSGTLPLFSASFFMTCLCSNMFMPAESFNDQSSFA